MLTWVEIKKAAIRHNILQFKKILGKDVLLMPVIKSNAYGHGFLAIAKICDSLGAVNRLCVASSEEAMILVEARIKKPIMILSFFDFNTEILLKLAKNHVIFPIFSLKQAKILNLVGDKLNKKIKIHIKLDTGTSRVGILPKDLAKFATQIKKLKFLKAEGVYSHFASSEEDGEYTKKQYNVFVNSLKILENTLGFVPEIKHMACTAAATSFSFNKLNAARIGLGIYGLYPSLKTKNKIKLKPALSWRAKIIQIKTLPKGTGVGYGGTYVTKKATKIAVLPIGYWDGYARSLSNKGIVLARGKKCSVLGRICMNLTMIDVSEIKKIKIGDTVTLLGKDKKQTISADNLAGWSNTINYEVVTRINPLITRILK